MYYPVLTSRKGISNIPQLSGKKLDNRERKELESELDKIKTEALLVSDGTSDESEADEKVYGVEKKKKAPSIRSRLDFLEKTFVRKKMALVKFGKHRLSLIQNYRQICTYMR